MTFIYSNHQGTVILNYFKGLAKARLFPAIFHFRQTINTRKNQWKNQWKLFDSHGKQEMINASRYFTCLQ